MYQLMKKLFPINRSLTGDGVRKSLAIINNEILNFDLNIVEIKSETKVFDWIIPNEWNVREAFITNSKGEKIIDFKQNNLHLVGYSSPINKIMKLKELYAHLYSLPEQPNAIPYITSYYSKKWGFCLTHNHLKTLKDDTYRVYIDSDLKKGSLTYAELIIPGVTEREIFFSTYICHPSMANNELSGPVLLTSIINYVSNLKDRYYTYRFVFVPETIGSITYLSKNLKALKKNVIAGYNITCVGDNNNYSFIPSRNGETLSDEVAEFVLNSMDIHFKRYTFLDRGSDERQYCSPGIDLPVSSIMRTKYGEYDEYHTSLDNLDFVSPNGLQGSYDVYTNVISTLENNFYPKMNIFGEPQLGKRNLYPNTSTKSSGEKVRDLMNVLAYCDGTKSILDISKITNVAFSNVLSNINKVIEKDSDLICISRYKH